MVSRKGVVMEHADLIRQLAEETMYTEYELRKLFQIFARLVREALVTGQDVHINGIGKLINKLCKPKKGRHPQTGVPITIPAKRRIRFKTCTALENMMRAVGNPLEEDPLKRFLKGASHGQVRSSARPGEGEDRSRGKDVPKVRTTDHRRSPKV